MKICGLFSIFSVGRSSLASLIKAILKIATVSLSPSFLVSTSFSVALHLRCLAWIKALANRSPWILWKGPKFKSPGEFVLLIFSAVTEVCHEVSVNKTGLSSKSSSHVKTIYVLNPRENQKMFFLIVAIAKS